MKTKYKAGLLTLLLGVFCLANCKSDPSTNSGNSNTGGSSQPAGDVTEGYTGGASYVTDAEAKANILGKLEKYAMDTKLTGITTNVFNFLRMLMVRAWVMFKDMELDF